jgi:hypothetical protein
MRVHCLQLRCCAVSANAAAFNPSLDSALGNSIIRKASLNRAFSAGAWGILTPGRCARLDADRAPSALELFKNVVEQHLGPAVIAAVRSLVVQAPIVG